MSDDAHAAWNEDLAHEWRVGDELPSHNDSCMVCGIDSATSPLVTRFAKLAGDDERVGARVRFDARHHQGAPAYAHGGAVAALLDDAMGYVSFLVLRMFVTAHLEVDYRRPVLLDHDYDVVAWCERIEGRKLFLASELRAIDDGAVVAESRGMFVTVDVEHFRP
jgi:uncharacterized protein (TIGR00369 family)